MNDRLEQTCAFLRENGLGSAAGLHGDLLNWLSMKGINVSGSPFAPMVRFIGVDEEYVEQAADILQHLLDEGDVW